MDILAPKGAYHVVGDVDSIISIKGFPSDSSIIVTSLSVDRVDKHSIIECLGGYNYIFAFGTDPNASAYRVNFIVLLGNKCSTTSGSSNEKPISDIFSYFEDNRVSQKKFVTVSIGSVTLNGILKSVSIVGAHPEINAVDVSVVVLGVKD